MTARPLIEPARSLILAIINAQDTPAERLDFAEIAHSHGHISDELLNAYEEAACERA